MVIQGFNPLTSVVEATSNGSFRYLTNMLPYETTEISYNMDDLEDTTHLYDFSSKNHFGEIDGALKFESGIYGRSFQWPGGRIKGDDLDIVGMSFTIEAWIFPTSADLIVVIGYESVFPIIYKATNGSMLYQYSGGSAAFYSNQSVNINIWTHVALVYDASSSVAKWYLNGLEQGAKQVGPRVLDGPWSIGRMRT
ncbi:MAG: LamG-like jellyroll fold domain-containing protein, partial [Promethearchaeota archaeon]